MGLKGVIIGSDSQMEWLLPWWWDRYQAHCNLPVAFADFGMTPLSKKWCEERGKVFAVARADIQCAIHPKRKQEWENHYTSLVWKSRPIWFLKPSALLLSPFERSLWIDLDCEVTGPIEPIFEVLDSEADVGLVRDRRKNRWVSYSSGVVLFRQKASIIADWAKLCLKKQNCYMGDENVIAHLIRKGGYRIQELPDTFNWMMYNGYHPAASIHHWGGAWGKEYIQKFGGLFGAPRNLNGGRPSDGEVSSVVDSPC